MKKRGTSNIYHTNNSSIDTDGLVFLVDNSHTNIKVIWNKIIGDERGDAGGYLISNDKYIIITGNEKYKRDSTNMLLVKMDDNGNEIWNKTYGGKMDELFNDVKKIDGGIIAVGHKQVQSIQKWAGFVVLTDNNGKVLWKKIFVDNVATGTSSVEVSKDGYIVVGYRGIFNIGLDDLFIAKLDKSGKTVWNHTIGGNYEDAGVWIQKYKGDQYYIVGYSDRNGLGKTGLWILKVELN